MKVTIIRGLPGSGKSTLARKLAEETGAILIEPDQMLIENGEYRYTPDRYAAAVERCRMMLDLISGWDGEGAKLQPDIIYSDVLPTAREVTAILESINGPYRLEMYTMSTDLPDCRNIHGVDPKDLIRFRRIFEWVECPDGKVRSLGRFFPQTDTEKTEKTEKTEIAKIGENSNTTKGQRIANKNLIKNAPEMWKNTANGQKNNANLLTQAPDMFQLIYSCCRIEHSFSRCEFRPESCKNCPIDIIIRKVEGEI